MGSVDPQAAAIRERLAQRRRRRFLTRLLVVILLVAVSGVVGYEYYSRSVGGDQPQESINVLLVAVEKVYPEVAENSGGAHSGAASGLYSLSDGLAPRASLQAAAVLTIDPRSGQAAVVTLPAMSLMPGAEVPTPAREPEERGSQEASLQPHTDASSDASPGAETLPDVLAERYRRGGVESLKAAVQELLNVPVHHYVQVDFEGFVQAVDRLQGLPVTVDMPIVYRDAEGNEVFRLDPGEHRLDGRAALYFLRYRGNDWLGEAPRARRHQAFLQSLGRTVLHEVTIADLPSYIELYRDYVTTDLDVVQMVRLAEMVWKAQPETVEVILLPGQPREGLWQPDDEAVGELVSRLFFHPAQE